MAWRPPAPTGDRAGADIAVVRLAGLPTVGIHPVTLAAVEAAPGTPVDVFGFPEGNERGVWARGSIAGEKADRTVQVDGNVGEGYEIRSGFSGAPVWDRRLGHVVGMVVSTERSTVVRSATLVPASELRRAAGLPDPLDARPFLPLIAGLSTGLGATERFLAEYCGTPERPAPFAGRAAQLDALDAWLTDPAESAAFLLAGAGRGKSALLAHWALDLAQSQAANVVFVPISIRFGTAERAVAAAMIGERLRFLTGGLMTTPQSPEGWIAEIDALLRVDQPVDKPLVLVIDGADEAVGWTFGRDLALPYQRGRNVRLVVSARPVAHRDADSWLEVLGLGLDATRLQLPNLTRSAVAIALASHVTSQQSWGPDVIDAVHALTEGDPLVLRLYVEALRDEGDRAPFLTAGDLATMQPGLDAYLDRWWADQQELWRRSGTRAADVASAEALLTLCAVALGPIGADEASFAAQGRLPTPIALRRTADALSRLLIGDGVTQGYVFSHPRLREHFVRRAGPHQVEAWRQLLVEHGRRAVAQLPTSTYERWTYAIRHHGAHLDEIEAGIDDFRPMMSDHWLRAWDAIDATYDGFRRDLYRTWERADAHRDVALQCRCALLASSLASMAGALPPEVMCALVESGLWSREYAVTYAFAIQTPREQAQALRALAPHLQEDEAARALERRRELDAQANAELVAALAPSMGRALREAVVEELLEESEGQIPADRATTLGLLTPLARAPRQWLAVALDRLQDQRDQRLRAQALQALAPLLDRDQLERALGRARAIMHLTHRAVTLATLGAHSEGLAAEEALRESVFAARAIVDVAARAETLARVAEAAPEAVMPGNVLDELYGAAAREEAPDRRARIRLALARIDSFSRRREALDAAIADAEAVQDRAAGALLLSRAAALRPRAGRRELLTRAIAVGRAIGDDVERAAFGVAVVGHPSMGALPDARAWAVRRLDALAGATLEERAEAVHWLAPVLGAADAADRAAKLLGEVDRLSDERRRAGLLATLSDLLSPHGVERAWEMARGISTAEARSSALVALSHRRGANALSETDDLPADTAADVIAAVLVHDPKLAPHAADAARRVRAPRARSHAIAAVLRAGVDDSALANEALDAATSVLGGRARLETLLELAVAGPAPLRDRAAERAAAQLGRVSHEGLRGSSLAAIATLSVDLRPQMLAVVSTLTDSAARTEALAVLGEPEAALAAAARVQSPVGQARAATALASIGAAPWEDAIARSSTIPLEAARAEALLRVIRLAPPACVGRAMIDGASMRDARRREQVLRAAAERAATVDLDDLATAWRSSLRALAEHSRPEFLRGLAALVDVAVTLAGPETVRECEAAVDAVGGWLP